MTLYERGTSRKRRGCLAMVQSDPIRVLALLALAAFALLFSMSRPVDPAPSYVAAPASLPELRYDRELARRQTEHHFLSPPARITATQRRTYRPGWARPSRTMAYQGARGLSAQHRIAAQPTR